jgi:hypothetical protein
MASIFEVMQESATRYRAHHVPFQQVAYAWGDRAYGKGVCVAMCLRWIKSTSPLSFFTHSEMGIGENQVLRAEIAAIQSTLRETELESQPYIAKKSGGGFGSRTVVKINNWSVDAPGYHTEVAGVKAVTYGKMLESAAKMCSCNPSRGSASLLGLEDGGTGHATATIRWHYNGAAAFYYMDPNGGLLVFPTDDQFRQWFVSELPTATDRSDNWKGYNNLQWITVATYDVLGLSSPGYDVVGLS